MRKVEWIVVAVLCLLTSIPAARADGLACQARKVIGRLELSVMSGNIATHYDLRIEDDIAYISGLQGRFYVVDIADPTTPQLLSDLSEFIPVSTYFDIDQGILYLSRGSEVQIVDVSDPVRPVVLGAIPIDEHSRAIEVAGDLMFVARFRDGFVIVDVSEPEAPVELSEVHGDYRISRFEVRGNLVYTIDDRGRLGIFDVSDPFAPQTISRTEVGFELEGFDVVGSAVYLMAASGDELKVFDVSDPAAPVEIGSSTRAAGLGISVVDGRAYLASCRLSVLDVDDPTEPQWLGEIELIGSAGVAVKVVDGLAYVLDRRYGLEIIDVSGSLESAVIGKGPSIETSLATGLDVDGSRAILNLLGLEVYDISDPAAPELLHRNWQTEFFAVEVRLIGGIVYAAGADGLKIHDLADSGILSTLSTIELPGSGTRFDVADHVVAIARREAGVRLIDVSDPASPVEIGSLVTEGEAVDVSLRGTLLYVADREAGLLVVDVQDPSLPVVLGSYNLVETLGLDVRGTIACVTTLDDGLLIFDVSNPGDPALLGNLPSQIWLSDVRIEGGIAFVSTVNERNLRMVDISDPIAPRLISGFCADPALPIRRGNHVYYGRSRLMISDLSDCPPCPPDLTGDGLLDLMDIERFLTLFAVGDDQADFVDDDRLDFYDVQAFLNLYAAGCP
jgi:hypothetical protein